MDPFIAGMWGGALAYCVLAAGAFTAGLISRLIEIRKTKRQGKVYREVLAEETVKVDEELYGDPEKDVDPDEPPQHAWAPRCMDPSCMDDTPHPPHTSFISGR